MIYPTKEFLEIFKKTPGALSVAESICIMNLAALAPEGVYAEIGSHKGKSGMSARVSLKPGKFYLVDPIYSDVGIRDRAMITVVMSYGMGGNGVEVSGVADYSTNVIQKYAPYSYFFWDSGEHAGEVLKKETELLEDAIIPGGILVSHDINNQFLEQKQAMEKLVSTGKYEWIPINWQEIFDYMKENNITEEDNNSWHTYPDLPHSPNFVGAIRRL